MCPSVPNRSRQKRTYSAALTVGEKAAQRVLRRGFESSSELESTSWKARDRPELGGTSTGNCLSSFWQVSLAAPSSREPGPYF
jgi:hypothetical protein